MSNKKTLYCQCYMERKTETSTSYLTSLVPVKYAKVGKVLKLKNIDKWSDGWVVKEVYEQVELPKDIRKIIKEHRIRTGDSSPKNTDSIFDGIK